MRMAQSVSGTVIQIDCAGNRKRSRAQHRRTYEIRLAWSGPLSGLGQQKTHGNADHRTTKRSARWPGPNGGGNVPLTWIAEGTTNGDEKERLDQRRVKEWREGKDGWPRRRAEGTCGGFDGYRQTGPSLARLCLAGDFSHLFHLWTFPLPAMEGLGIWGGGGGDGEGGDKQ